MSTALRVRVLVLDDVVAHARERLRGAVNLLVGREPVSDLPPWSVTLDPDFKLRVECEFLDSPDTAERTLTTPQALQDYDLVLLDNDWSECAESEDFGLRLLERSSKGAGFRPLLAIYTAAASYSHTFIARALVAGASALVMKTEPVHLLNLLLTAADVGRLRRLEPRLAASLERADGRLHTDSPAMARALADAAAFAVHRDLPILITGATGTGKELIAQAIHKVSPRCAGPFEVLDCSTLAETVAESRLFGHEKGAFTGAQATHRGVLERANKGTLFLDEVHSLSLASQGKLLRAVEYGKFYRVGGAKELATDVRVVAATNQDLMSLVEKGIFLGDLYHRLAYGLVQVPSLDARPEDIPALAKGILIAFARRNQRSAIRLHDDALRSLMEHSWRWNIRELKATLERSSALIIGDTLTEENLRYGVKTEPSQLPDNPGYLLTLAPRRGGQRLLFDLLLRNFGTWVSYSDLQSVLGIAPPADSSTASDLLMAKVSVLRRRLQGSPYSIERDESGTPSQGYRLIRA